MPDYLGDDMRKQKKDAKSEEDKPYQGNFLFLTFYSWLSGRRDKKFKGM